MSAHPVRPLANERQNSAINNTIVKAQNSWLKKEEILTLLKSVGSVPGLIVSTKAPFQPPAGSLFIFDKKACRYFRKDGHPWEVKDDGKTVIETHEKLKVNGVEVLNCYYAKSRVDDLKRRSYWRLDVPPGEPMYALVHYRHAKGRKRKAEEEGEEEGGEETEGEEAEARPGGRPTEGSGQVAQEQARELELGRVELQQVQPDSMAHVSSLQGSAWCRASSGELATIPSEIEQQPGSSRSSDRTVGMPTHPYPALANASASSSTHQMATPSLLAQMPNSSPPVLKLATAHPVPVQLSAQLLPSVQPVSVQPFFPQPAATTGLVPLNLLFPLQQAPQQMLALPAVVQLATAQTMQGPSMPSMQATSDSSAPSSERQGAPLPQPVQQELLGSNMHWLAGQPEPGQQALSACDLDMGDLLAQSPPSSMDQGLNRSLPLNKEPYKPAYDG